MSTTSVDASNACIPPSYPLVASTPPLPTTVRGEPCVFDGRGGRLNGEQPVLLYSSHRLVIVRELDGDVGLNDERSVRAFVYRGHMANVTAARFAPSGYYVASADARGKLRVWSYDNEEHLCKLELNALTGPIRDISWDLDSKRICLVGERMDVTSDCAKAIQWDTGVTVGELGQHTRGRASSCDFKPNRPMRIITGGMDDSRCIFNAGPPFKRVVDGTPSEHCHTKGAVNSVRFSADGKRIASVGSDKAVCIYDGKTMALISKLEDVHEGTIFACSWNASGDHLLTCSSDGTAKLLSADPLEVVHTWKVAELMNGGSPFEEHVPLGGMLLGCTFTKGDIPVVVTFNGEISILPRAPAQGTEGFAEYKRLTGHTAPIAGLVINHKTGTLFTGDTDGTVCHWASTSKSIKRMATTGSTDLLGKVHGDAVISCLAITSSGYVLSAGWDDKIRFVDPDGNLTETVIALEAQPNAMSCGTELVAVVTVGGIVLIKDEAAVSPLQALETQARAACVSSDDSTVYVAGDDHNIYIYSVTDTYELEKKHVIERAHLNAIHALRLSHDGTKLASAGIRDVCVWRTDDYSQVVGKSRWCFHMQRITSLAWSPDDAILASGGADDAIYLWSLEKKTKRIHYGFTHRGGVSGLEFLDSGYRLVSVGADACLNEWDVASDIAKKFG